MGRIYPGASPHLLTLLYKDCGAKTFVETGTFFGSTTTAASRIFDRVFTIESSEAIYAVSQPMLARIPNVAPIFGDSVAHLPQVIGRLTEPAVFWLDAHWCGGNTDGKETKCPLLEEIRAINESSLQHYVLIDDARAFTAPLEPPYDPALFPDITTVLSALNASPYTRYVAIIEDVIIAVPLSAKERIVRYCQDLNQQILRRLFF